MSRDDLLARPARGADRRAARRQRNGSFVHGGAGSAGAADWPRGFGPGKPGRPSEVSRLESELAGASGRPVDLGAGRDLSARFRDEVLSEAEVLCAP